MERPSWERRLILVSTDRQKDGLNHDDKGLELLKNEQLMVLPMSQANLFDNHLTLMGENGLQPGTMLAMSPFDDNVYVDIENARELIAIEKASLTMRLCGLLGAKSVETKNMKIVDTESRKEACIGGGKSGVATGKLTAAYSDLENFKNKIENNSIFSGGNPNVEKAEQFLRASRLINDPLLKQMVNIVRDGEETGNKIKELNQEVSLTQSLQKTFELAANINFPGGLVSGGYKSKVEEKTEYFISIVIKF